ncbi:MAG: GTP-binding protein [Methanomassiliicoccales archaeon]|nr:MAG: GTP-binding protein [Methanomassiliicoccales archaeon]
MGKTSLIRRYVIDEFHDHYIETIGTKISRKEIELEVEGKEFSLSLQIWDLLGQKAYTAVQSRAFIGMDGAMLVADITRKETLDSIESYWLPTLKRVVPVAPLIFLANKMDLKSDARMTLDDVINISLDYSTPGLNNAFLTSAKTGENVEEVFLTLAKMILSSQIIEDPTKEIFEELMADSVIMEMDKTSLKGVTDAIITDFCDGFEDKNKGMRILREQFIKAGVGVSNPTKSGIIKAIDYMAEEELKFLDANTVQLKKEKRLQMVRDAKEEETG